MNKTTLLAFAFLPALAASAQSDTIDVSYGTLSALTRTVTLSHSAIHDPSIVRGDDTYYIFGTHRGQASSSDLKNWTYFTAPWGRYNASGTITSGVDNSEAFNTPKLSTVTQNGATLELPAFDAEAWAAATSTSYDVGGNMWAPDIIYNKDMEKWCLYLSINGDKWASSIILLTSNSPTGTFTYQAPVVISGFQWDTNPYTSTDLELAIGTQASLPARYDRGDQWGNYWPNNIDPCVFYDEEGQLWMSYGSWSGGIFLLRLDNATGLRDYSYTPSVSNDASGRPLADPYFGTRIAGGYYVSGEGSYIEHIGNYYYLFMTYGGLTSTGGYVMRVFRSENVDGPYVDSRGNSAIYSRYLLNYGKGDAAHIGDLLMSAYTGLANQTVGELAQGHNSALLDTDGRAYLVYHTRFDDGAEGFQNRIHQLFVNEDGWLVCAPFEFAGETVTDDSIKAGCAYAADELAGTYQVLLHQYGLDAENRECAEPQHITLTATGAVTGDLKGSWRLTAGTGYITLTVGGVTYKGVVASQTIDGSSATAIVFTAASTQGTALWGWKKDPLSLLAEAVVGAELPVKDGSAVSGNLDLSLDLPDGVTATWTSSQPELLSDDGKYSPTDTDTPVTLSLTYQSGRYRYSTSYDVNVRAARTVEGDYKSGMVAYYNFNERPIVNSLDSTQVASLRKQSSGTTAELTTHVARFGSVLHTYAGNETNRTCSFATLPNPLLGQTDLEGFTVAMWVRREAADPWGALWAFAEKNPSIYNSQNHLGMSGNVYIDFTNSVDTFAVNNPAKSIVSWLPEGEWKHVAIAISPANRIYIYINGVRRSVSEFASTQGAYAKFDFQTVLDFVASAEYFALGKGNGHGSAPALYDDLIIYNRALTRQDVSALYAAENQVSELSTGDFVTAISAVEADHTAPRLSEGVYDLSGRRVSQPAKGLYIVGGKKVLVR